MYRRIAVLRMSDFLEIYNNYAYHIVLSHQWARSFVCLFVCLRMNIDKTYKRECIVSIWWILRNELYFCKVWYYQFHFNKKPCCAIFCEIYVMLVLLLKIKGKLLTDISKQALRRQIRPHVTKSIKCVCPTPCNFNAMCVSSHIYHNFT